jgi:hypothetical protein
MGVLYRPRITLLLASPVGRACGCKKVALRRVQPMGGASPRQDSRTSRDADIPVPLGSFRPDAFGTSPQHPRRPQERHMWEIYAYQNAEPTTTRITIWDSTN